MYENPGDEARLPLVVDEAEVLARVDGEHGRHVKAEVGRGEVHPVGCPQDHSSLRIVRDELGRGALLGPSMAAPKAALGEGANLILSSFIYVQSDERPRHRKVNYSRFGAALGVIGPKPRVIVFLVIKLS